MGPKMRKAFLLGLSSAVTALALAFPLPAHAATALALPTVKAATLTDAFHACFDAYADADSAVYFDCVNAAYAHFQGRGHHSRFWNI